MSPWYPNAERIPADRAGVMDGSEGTRKVVIHTEGVTRGKGGRSGNAIQLARYVADRGIAYHFIIDRSGRIAQCYPADVAARALKPGAYSPNRQGVRAIQVCFAGVESMDEVDDWPLTGWAGLLQWLEREHGIPPTTPVDLNRSTRSTRAWIRSGWTTHAHAPFNDHTDGIGTDLDRLLAASLRRRPGGAGYRVAATRRGKRRQVYLKAGRFTFRPDGARGRLTRRQARLAKRWALARRGVSDAEIRSGKVPLFAELADGARWPKDGVLVRRLDLVGRKRGRRVRIVSGYRSIEDQRRLWDLWKAGKGNLAAYPNPNAPHVRGVAADVGTVDAKGNYRSLGNDAEAAYHARRLGLAALVPGEPWHYQRRSTY